MVYPVFFRKMKEGVGVVNPQVRWGIVCKEFPFRLYGKAKDLPERKWFDEHGVEAFVPDTLFIDAYELKAEFAYKGDAFSANEVIREFLDYLTGNDGQGEGARLEVYDAYTRIGRRDVHYLSVENDMMVRNSGEGDVFTFSINFKVNDPMTDVVLGGGV
jgi:hypothetical protein